MNVAYVNPFIRATIDTYKTMLHIDPVPGKPMLKTEPAACYDVSGIIGLSGDAVGSIALSFPQDVALRTISALLGAEITEVGPELSDGIGELANIIAGNAKQHLDGLNLLISLPNVIIGKDHHIMIQRDIPTLVVPFTTPIGLFGMEVSLKT